MAALARLTCGSSRLSLKTCTLACYQRLSKSSTAGDHHIDITYSQFSQPTRRASGEVRPICRATENDPAKHSANHQGLYYSVPEGDFQQWMTRAVPPMWDKLTRSFNEHCIMIREPALEIIDNMKAANYHFPSVRYILYGKKGVGKTMTMAHLMHYCASQEWITLHVPWAAQYCRYSKESQASVWNPERCDQPLEACDWLSYFLNTNLPLIKKHDLKTVNKYVWSKREMAEVGTPLPEVIDFGLGRAKYATDVMGAILKEIRTQASQKGFRVLVAIDGVNAFWGPTVIKYENNPRQKYEAKDLAIVHHWKKMMKNDWAGGAVVTSVDSFAAQDPDKQNAFMPLALLGKDGFEFMDPHIPVHVPLYSNKEARSCLEYYIDRKWIQNPHGHTEEGMRELMFLSSNNPFEMYSLTRAW